MIEERLGPFFKQLASLYSSIPSVATLEEVNKASRLLSLEHVYLSEILLRTRLRDATSSTLETLWSLGHDVERILSARVASTPNNVALHDLLRKAQLYRNVEASSEPRIVNVGFFLPDRGNFGDRVLSDAVCTALSVDPKAVQKKHVHQLFTDLEARRLDENCAVVVGGGGLILHDTRPNSRSGWQWNVSASTLEELGRRNVNLSMFGVGVNFFDANAPIQRLTKKTLTIFADNATVIGLRNHGSIERMLDYVGEDTHHKIVYCPCPTILGLRGAKQDDFPESLSLVRVGLNIAYDRADQRFSDLHQFEREVVGLCRKLVDSGVEIHLLAHLKRDETICNALRAEGIEFRLWSFYEMSVTNVLNVLGTLDLVIGARGHAQMIPFGLGIPFVTIDSHPKTRYFANDAGLGEFVVDANDRNFAHASFEMVQAMVDQWRDLRQVLESKRSEMRTAITRTAQRVGIQGAP